MALLKIEMTDWGGLPRAQCPLCRTGAVGRTEEQAKKKIRRHMWERHVAAVEAHREEEARMKATLFDGDGKPITRMPLSDDEAFEEFKTQLKENQ